VANRDLWETLFALALDPGRAVTFEWVKGHSGDRMNDVVDALATEAAARQEPGGPPPGTGLGQGRLLP
jgi:ribonuclease HI